MSRNIALMGMMGVGKSTLATLLGARLGRLAVDTDTEIERWIGKPIPRIFQEEGEAAFRAYESRVIEELARVDDLVIALGGGAVLSDGNVASFLLTGVLVELRVDAATLAARLLDGAGRPLLEGGDVTERVATLLAERGSRYAEVADVTIDASGTPDEVLGRLIDWLLATPDVLTPSEYEAIMG